MSEVSNYKVKNVEAITATILSGQTESDVIDLQGTSISGFFTPAILTGTSFTFLVENEVTGSFLTMKDSTGAAVAVTVAADGFYTLSPTTFYSARKIKIVSDASEAGDRQIIVKPYPIS